MNRQDIQKLLGGYATGTLTPEEQQVLFTAALEDQALFDALAQEQALRDLLKDPASKAQLLAALDDRPAAWWSAWFRPATAALAMAGLAVAGFLVLRPKAPIRTELAIVKSVVPLPSAPPVASVSTAAGQQGQALADEPKPAAPGPASSNIAIGRQAGDVKRSGEAKPVDKVAAETREKDAEALDQRKQKEEQQSLRREFQAPAPAKPQETPPAGVPEPAPPPRALPMQQAAQGPLPAPVMPFRDSDSRAGAAGFAPGGSGGGVRRAETPRQPAPQFALASADSSADATSARVLFLKAAEAAAASAGAATAGKDDRPTTERAKSAPRNPGLIGASNAIARPSTAASPTANPGIRYSFSHRSDYGLWTHADPADLKTGESIMLTFTPNEAGQLLVQGEDDRVLISTNVEPLHSYPTEELRAGEKKVTVVFTRQRQTLGGLYTKASLQQEAAPEGTYVVGNAAAQTVTFPITINYKAPTEKKD